MSADRSWSPWRRLAVGALGGAVILGAGVAAVWQGDGGGDVSRGDPSETRSGELDGGEDPARVDAVLGRAIEASREVPHGGRLAVISFEDASPSVSEMSVTRGDDAVRLARDGRVPGDDGANGDAANGAERWEIGRVGGQAFLRSSEELLRIGGVESAPAQLDRLRVKYRVVVGDEVVLDTGQAATLHLVERSTGLRREALYLDDDTGLIVRRETFGADGSPVRLVAYTHLHVDPTAVTAPSGDGIDVREHLHATAEVDDLVAAGRWVEPELPGGYELVAATKVEGATTPAVHLLYGDGLYSLSLFQQDGRLARNAVRGATELAVPDGGAVWRWPGSEPRRVVWSGGGRTFTVLTDAPVDEMLVAIAGLPVDPAPSILDRLRRGLTRAGDWLSSGDGSDP